MGILDKGILYGILYSKLHLVFCILVCQFLFLSGFGTWIFWFQRDEF